MINTEKKSHAESYEFQFYWGLTEGYGAGDGLSERPGSCCQGIKGEISIYATLWKRANLIPQTDGESRARGGEWLLI